MVCLEAEMKATKIAKTMTNKNGDKWAWKKNLSARVIFYLSVLHPAFFSIRVRHEVYNATFFYFSPPHNSNRPIIDATVLQNLVFLTHSPALSPLWCTGLGLMY